MNLSSLPKLIQRTFVILALISAGIIFPTLGKAEIIINQIIVEGNERIETETVKSYLSIVSGDVFAVKKINSSLKRLFSTGLFADVNMRREGQSLVVRVAENPIINRVAFEGNKRIEDDDLELEIQLRPRVVYTRTRVQNDVQRIIQIYRRSGRFAATIDPKIVQLSQNRVDLIFEIDEGPLTGIRRISFVGNKAFSDGSLRDQIKTRETAWWRILTTDDTYDPERLTFDRELLRKFYLAEGYADFRVVSAIAELTRDRKDFYVTFSIEEGNRYTYGEVGIKSELPDLDGASLLPLLELDTGEWYNADHVEDTIQNLTNSVGDLGYAFVDIRPIIDLNREKNSVNVTFEIEEGPRVYVQRINIDGNFRTREEVIRREFQLVEGDAFNTAKIRRSRQKIRDLGIFESVDIQTKQGDRRDLSVLNVSVEETSTGEISFGAGISSVDGLIGDVGIRERNLLGRGQELRLGVSFSSRRQEVDASFTEPYFLDKDVSAGFDVFRKNIDLQDESSFDKDTVGSTLRSNYSLMKDLRHGINYTLRRDEISQVASTASQLIKEQKGAAITSSVGQNFLYDKRDSRIKPTEGYSISLGQDFAGIGGDVTFLRNTITSTYYWPVYSNWVVGTRIKGGYIAGLGEKVRITDKFFVGGSTLRGFESSGVGPRDAVTGDALGGNTFFSSGAELLIPLNITKDFDLDGAIFSDLGTNYNGNYTKGASEILEDVSPRASMGVGFSYASPLGPIRVDYAVPVLKENFDRVERFRFSFGGRF